MANTMKEPEFLMAQAVADAVGATKRQIQIWTDADVLHCLPGTDRQGRGRQRLYHREELPIAVLVAALARLKVPIGDLRGYMIYVRLYINDAPVNLAIRVGVWSSAWYRSALRGEIESFVLFGVPGVGLHPGLKSFAWADGERMLALLKEGTGGIVLNVRELVDRLSLAAPLGDSALPEPA